jgi:tetratricopeptide (TPR) repeat protein
MRRWLVLPVVLLFSALAFGQSGSPATPDDGPLQTEAPPRSDNSANTNESSSKATKIDISPPKDDSKNHPDSGKPEFEDAGSNGNTDVQEMHPFDPYKAGKDDEVGLFYFKQKNYKAALARFEDALKWKENDAEANFRIAQCQEKLNNPAEAALHYQAYLKILPYGPYAKDATKALKQMKTKGLIPDSESKPAATSPTG